MSPVHCCWILCWPSLLLKKPRLKERKYFTAWYNLLRDEPDRVRYQTYFLRGIESKSPANIKKIATEDVWILRNMLSKTKEWYIDCIWVRKCDVNGKAVRRCTSDNKYLNWTCRTERVPISRTLVLNGTYWYELLSPPL